MRRDELTDEQWERLEPLLPPQKPHTGRPAEDHRRILSGILWIHRTGAPWRDLPGEYGPWQTVATRFYRWVKARLWDRILATLQRHGDAAGKLDWSQHYVDGTVVRAHQHAAGAHPEGGGQQQQALGRSQGGFSTKIHMRAEGGGKPITFLLTAGQLHEQSVFAPLMEHGAVKRAGRGQPRLRPDRVVGDKGYSSRKVRRYLQRRGICAVIARRSNEPSQKRFDRERYRERNRVERLINRLKQARRVATRYEKLAVNYLAMVTIAAILIWL
jgi:transposase